MDVLKEFMQDVLQACSKGGRVCAHQLEFDAGVIKEELRRCGLYAMQSEWERIAKDGYCTMNPGVGRWLLMCSGEDVGPETKQHTLGLDVMMRRLGLTRQYPNLTQQHHSAASDAQMTRLLYAAILDRANGRP